MPDYPNTYRETYVEIRYLVAYVRGYIATNQSALELILSNKQMVDSQISDTTVGELLTLLIGSSQKMSERLLEAEDYAEYLEDNSDENSEN